jgi:phenylacetate-coenzyme A ligase PaaK-like adenylate-forming protein
VDYETTRLAHIAQLSQSYLSNADALNWDRQAITDFQTGRLRWLLSHAKQQSPFWRERLADIDTSSFSLDQLGELPILDKRQMMANWPDLISLRGISLDEAYAFLQDLQDDQYFHDSYHLVASGGSSGEPALFLYDWDGWAGCASAMGRYQSRLADQYPALVQSPGIGVNVGAEKASHMTFALSSTFAPKGVVPERIPVSWPLERIVERLNQLQPARITGYPSMIMLLTEEARCGRLTIAPQSIQPSSEPLTREIRQAIKDTWDPFIQNIWGCSEACAVANSYALDQGMYVNEDFVIIEPVDADNQPVPAGVTAEKVLLTNLFNLAQPLIRYELTDQVTVMTEPSPSGIAFMRIEDIQGRTDDIFSYGTVRVHPILFRGPLAKTPGLLEFQVWQTLKGARIDYLANAPVDESRLQQDLQRALADTGVLNPVIELSRTTQLVRVGVGKLKRFFSQ